MEDAGNARDWFIAPDVWESHPDQLLKRLKVKVPDLMAWLLERSSMSQRIEKTGGSPIQINCLAQSYFVLRPDEAELLRKSLSERVLTRSVTIWCRHIPCMFAQTLFSNRLINQTGDLFAQLGNVSLGKVLFQSPDLKRSPFQYALIELNDKLCRLVDSETGLKSSLLWARRSVFWYQDAPLLLTEVFFARFTDIIGQREYLITS